MTGKAERGGIGLSKVPPYEQMKSIVKKRLLILGMIAGFCIWRVEPSSFYLSALPAGCCMLVLQYEAVKKNVWDYISGGMITFGMVANLLAISFNDGYMPVITQRAVTSYGRWRPAADGDPLLFLCDRIYIGIAILSIGDLMMAAGLVLSIVAANVIAYRRVRERRRKDRAVFDSFRPEKKEELRVLYRKVTGKEPKC